MSHFSKNLIYKTTLIFHFIRKLRHESSSLMVSVSRNSAWREPSYTSESFQTLHFRQFRGRDFSRLPMVQRRDCVLSLEEWWVYGDALLRRETCALLRAKTSALLRRKTSAVLRARKADSSIHRFTGSPIRFGSVLFPSTSAPICSLLVESARVDRFANSGQLADSNRTSEPVCPIRIREPLW